jgi:hypothetical protein
MTELQVMLGGHWASTTPVPTGVNAGRTMALAGRIDR